MRRSSRCRCDIVTSFTSILGRSLLTILLLLVLSLSRRCFSQVAALFVSSSTPTSLLIALLLAWLAVVLRVDRRLVVELNSLLFNSLEKAFVTGLYSRIACL